MKYKASFPSVTLWPVPHLEGSKSRANAAEERKEVSGVLVLFSFYFTPKHLCVWRSDGPCGKLRIEPFSACFFLARDHGWAKHSFSPLVPVRERKLVSENFHLALARHAERVRWTRAKVPVFGSFARELCCCRRSQSIVPVRMVRGSTGLSLSHKGEGTVNSCFGGSGLALWIVMRVSPV